jgi:hypothetical protein
VGQVLSLYTEKGATKLRWTEGAQRPVFRVNESKKGVRVSYVRVAQPKPLGKDILLTVLLVFSHAYSGRKSVIEMAFMCIAVSFP